jgi:hypothetical protein
LQGLVFPAPVPIFAARRSTNEYVTLGLAAALALTRLLKTWLFVVGATDSPKILVIVLLLVHCVAGLLDTSGAGNKGRSVDGAAPKLSHECVNARSRRNVYLY